jgi:hypothetical protein
VDIKSVGYADRSASVANVVALDPTAVQALVETQDTLESAAAALVGLGVVSILQVKPFQTSASVVTNPPAFAKPTAVHIVGDVHDTLCKIFRPGFGVGTIVHACPSHCSVRASTVA